MSTITPILDRILVTVDSASEELTAGGIIIKSEKESKPNTGTVVAVGRGIPNGVGGFSSPNFIVGDRVMFPPFGGVKIEVQGIPFLLMKEEEVFVKIS